MTGSKPHGNASGPDPAVRFLFCLLCFAASLGALLCAAAVIAELSANGCDGWLRATDQAPALARFVDRFPWLSLCQPALADGHFRYDGTLAHIFYYGRWAVLDAAVLGSLLFFRTTVQGWIQSAWAWTNTDDSQASRRKVAATVAWLSLATLLGAHTGIWFPGIVGWTYQDVTTSISSDSLTATTSVPAFLNNALLEENIQSFAGRGMTSGRVMLLHFEDGSVHAANYGLLPFVFADNVFGEMYREVRYPKAFFQIVQTALRNRQNDRRALLPLAIAYPQHAVYLDLDYWDTPPADQLVGISFWTLVLRIHSSGIAQIVDARRERLIRRVAP